MKTITAVFLIIQLSTGAIASRNLFSELLRARALVIIRDNCLTCHGALKTSALDLRSRSTILAGGKHGVAVVLGNPLFLLGYVIDAPMLLVPALSKAVRRKETGRALVSIPAFFVLRTVNGLFFLEAFWAECIMRRPFRVYEKGH